MKSLRRYLPALLVACNACLLVLQLFRNFGVKPLPGVVEEDVLQQTTLTLHSQHDHAIEVMPQVDEPQVDEPQVDEPQVDEPQMDEPQMDEPKGAAVFILGMHHSGTSLLTMMLKTFGLQLGPEKGLIMLKGNPAKFFELKSAVHMNENFVHGNYGYGYAWNKTKPVTREKYLNGVRNILRSLNRMAGESRSWLLKDPRISLVAEIWLSLVQERKPICVLTARDPYITSSRFSKGWMLRQDLQKSIDLWEEYYVRAIEGCRRVGASTIISDHELLMNDPSEAARRLFADFQAARVGGISMPTPAVLKENFTKFWFDPDVVAKDTDAEQDRLEAYKSLISPRAKKIWEALSTKNLNILSDEELRPISWRLPWKWIDVSEQTPKPKPAAPKVKASEPETTKLVKSEPHNPQMTRSGTSKSGATELAKSEPRNVQRAKPETSGAGTGDKTSGSS